METADSHPEPDDAQIEAQILRSLSERDAQSSCCPSEVARALAAGGCESWRPLMPRIRNVAAKLALQRRVLLTRGSHPIVGGDFRGGPIRIRRGARF